MGENSEFFTVVLLHFYGWKEVKEDGGQLVKKTFLTCTGWQRKRYCKLVKGYLYNVFVNSYFPGGENFSINIKL